MRSYCGFSTPFSLNFRLVSSWCFPTILWQVKLATSEVVNFITNRMSQFQMAAESYTVIYREYMRSNNLHWSSSLRMIFTNSLPCLWICLTCLKLSVMFASITHLLPTLFHLITSLLMNWEKIIFILGCIYREVVVHFRCCINQFYVMWLIFVPASTL